MLKKNKSKTQELTFHRLCIKNLLVLCPVSGIDQLMSVWITVLFYWETSGNNTEDMQSVTISSDYQRLQVNLSILVWYLCLKWPNYEHSEELD